MPANVVHFAIHAEDTARARRFYAAVFGWRFTPWGPPDFYQIATGTAAEPGIHGALHGRAHSANSTDAVTGYECTISVESVDHTAAAIEAHGGTIVTPKMQIPGVGWLIQFRDTEGNVARAMRYNAVCLAQLRRHSPAHPRARDSHLPQTKILTTTDPRASYHSVAD